MCRSCLIIFTVLASFCSADVFDDVLGVFLSSRSTSKQNSFTRKAVFPGFKLERHRSPYYAVRQTPEQMTEQLTEQPTAQTTEQAENPFNDPCREVFECVSPDFDEPEGNIYSGIRFNLKVLKDQLCQFTEQYQECYQRAQSSNTCGILTTRIANATRIMHYMFCQQSCDPEILSLLQCLNNRRAQIDVAAQVREIQGEFDVYDKMEINITSYSQLVCQSRNRFIGKVLRRVENHCGENVRNMICFLLTETEISLPILHPGLECPLGRCYSLRRYPDDGRSQIWRK